jgi:hypothetical protein
MSATFDTVQAALLDNADWQSDNSLSKAKLFVAAAKQFFILSPNSSQSPGGFSMSINAMQIKQLHDEAASFIASANAAANGGASIEILGACHGFR